MIYEYMGRWYIRRLVNKSFASEQEAIAYRVNVIWL